MRLALIGPSNGNMQALRERAAFVLDTLQVDRAVYLGIDGALDTVVHQWAAALVHGEPSDDALWGRAAEACASAPYERIDAFIEQERQRMRLKLLECLPDATAKTAEVLSGLMTLIIHDKALLQEDDIASATILAYGKCREPGFHRIGKRVFIGPGPVTHPTGGVALLSDEPEGVVVAIHGADGQCARRELVAQALNVRVTVQGA